MNNSVNIPRKCDNLLERDLGDAIVVMTQAGEVLHTLKGSALFIWRLMDARLTEDSLVAALMDEYEVEAGQAGKDLQTFLQALTVSNLIQSPEQRPV